MCIVLREGRKALRSWAVAAAAAPPAPPAAADVAEYIHFYWTLTASTVQSRVLGSGDGIVVYFNVRVGQKPSSWPGLVAGTAQQCEFL